MHVHAFVLDVDPSEAVATTISRHALLISATHDTAKGGCLRLFDLSKTIVVAVDSLRCIRGFVSKKMLGPNLSGARPAHLHGASRNEREKDLS